MLSMKALLAEISPEGEKPENLLNKIYLSTVALKDVSKAIYPGHGNTGKDRNEKEFDCKLTYAKVVSREKQN
jgi:hypothetical protein